MVTSEPFEEDDAPDPGSSSSFALLFARPPATTYEREAIAEVQVELREHEESSARAWFWYVLVGSLTIVGVLYAFVSETTALVGVFTSMVTTTLIWVALRNNVNRTRKLTQPIPRDPSDPCQ